MQICFDAESLYSHLIILCVVGGFSFMFKKVPKIIDIHIKCKFVLPTFWLYYTIVHVKGSENTGLTGQNPLLLHYSIYV